MPVSFRFRRTALEASLWSMFCTTYRIAADSSSKRRDVYVLTGSLVMIEPWVSTWSRQIYTHLHHEPFEWNTSDWSFPEAGPLSGANGALPWIVFHRDRSQFESGFPELHIQTIQPLMPFRYLISGGVSMRQLMPGFSFQIWKKVEAALSRWPQHWPMFALIRIRGAEAMQSIDFTWLPETLARLIATQFLRRLCHNRLEGMVAKKRIRI
jgi:hypothetical protein